MKSKPCDLLTESYEKALVPSLPELEGPSARRANGKLYYEA